MTRDELRSRRDTSPDLAAALDARFPAAWNTFSRWYEIAAPVPEAIECFVAGWDAHGAAVLDRAFARGSIVEHKDGDPRNNELSNLEIRQSTTDAYAARELARADAANVERVSPELREWFFGALRGAPSVNREESSDA